MKKFAYILTFCCFIVLNISACGYKIHGYNEDNSSLLGDGTKSISIGEIVQSSLYTDVPYYTASQIRDEIALRRIAKWASQGKGDYEINVNIPTFRLRNFESTDVENVLVSSLDIAIIISINNRITGENIWTSSRISYSENYENPRESIVIKEVLTDVIRQAFDMLQSASF